MTDNPNKRDKSDKDKEKILDEALKESFPASDPPAITDPSAHLGEPAAPEPPSPKEHSGPPKPKRQKKRK